MLFAEPQFRNVRLGRWASLSLAKLRSNQTQVRKHGVSELYQEKMMCTYTNFVASAQASFYGQRPNIEDVPSDETCRKPNLFVASEDSCENS